MCGVCLYACRYRFMCYHMHACTHVEARKRVRCPLLSLPVLRQGISLTPGIMFSQRDCKLASPSDPRLLILLKPGVPAVHRAYLGSNVGTGRHALVLRVVQEAFLTLAPFLQLPT